MSFQMFPICLLIFGFHYLVIGVKDGLYDTEDNDVVPLNNESFQNKVLNGKPDVLWVVEFYNSWCGHCIHFAPTWKSVAKDLKDWQDLVVVAAVDCSQSINLETCRKYDVNAYPTIKIFPPASVKNGKIEHIGTQDVEVIKKTILDFMWKYPAESWPHLQPLENIEDIWHERKNSHDHVLLIFEEQDSQVGIQVIIDVRNISNVLVRRMWKDSVAKYGITKFPSLYKVRPDSTYSMLAVGTKMKAEDRQAFVKTIMDLAERKEGTDVEHVEMSQKIQKSLSEEFNSSVLRFGEQFNSSFVSMQDLESALHYSFRQEVAIRKVIAGEQLQALRKFVQVLLKYFPGRKPVVGFLERVNDMLRKLNADSITGDTWLTKIDSLQDSENYLPEVIKWESCQGSFPRYRGYPCSMWTLYHTLTVSAYNENLRTRQSNPQEVLVAVRGYMQHFFGCGECSKHFLQMAETIEEEVHSHKDSVLWLWSAHNKANKRLKGDVSEDPIHPKIEFPSEKMCPQCHTVLTTDAGAKISWVMDKVLDFLVNFYSEKNIVLSKSLGAVFHRAAKSRINMSVEKKEADWWENKLREEDLRQIRLLREKKREKGKFVLNQKIREDTDSAQTRSKVNGTYALHLWGLSHIDFSLCVIFYLLSTVILLTLYHHFIVRRRMMPCRNIIS